jgi:hypothetical protein
MFSSNKARSDVALNYLEVNRSLVSMLHLWAWLTVGKAFGSLECSSAVYLPILRVFVITREFVSSGVTLKTSSSTVETWSLSSESSQTFSFCFYTIMTEEFDSGGPSSSASWTRIGVRVGFERLLWVSEGSRMREAS